MSTVVTLDRTGLGLGDLTIPGSPPAGDGLFLSLGGLSSPAFDVRATYAPESAYVGGSHLLAAVLAASTLPLGVTVQASSPAALAALQDELEAACWQFAYTVTVDVDGVVHSWDAGPCWPAWGELTSHLSQAHLAQAAVVIPVNPGA